MPSNFPPNKTPLAREELHQRQLDLRGFRRSDGLYEVEARLVDRKTHDFVTHSDGGKPVPAGHPVHEMGVRLVYDDKLRVHEVSTFTAAAPYAQCPDGGLALQSLTGLQMTKGWGREVRARLAGYRSCTHLQELLMPLATVALQTLSEVRRHRPDATDASGRPLKIDSCYAYGAEREVVRQRWPQYFLTEARPISDE